MILVYALTIWIDVGRLVTNGRGSYDKWISVGGDTNRYPNFFILSSKIYDSSMLKKDSTAQNLRPIEVESPQPEERG